MVKAWTPPTYSKKKSSQTVNARELFGRNLDQGEKEEFAQSLIDLIRNRTLSGVNIRGTEFKQYSKKYAEQKGVSRDAVDMFLKGDMLESIEAKISGQNITLEIDGGVDALKSFNHNTGDTLPKRQFFGIQKKDLDEVVSSVKQSLSDPEKELRDALRDVRLVQEE